MDIVVLCGGLSPERNVSFSSGSMIAAALKNKGHRVVPLDMYIGLENYAGDPLTIFENPPAVGDASVDRREPDLEEVKHARRDQSASLFGPGVLATCQKADLVFIALHGICGEDGRVQATFELLDIPFTGSGPFASAVALDKDLTKRILRQEGVLTPDWHMLDGENLDAAIQTLRLPCVVKPVDSGSSIGVGIAFDRDGLKRALKLAAKEGRKILVEDYVKGRELSAGVLDGRALPGIELIPKVGFYDYKNKYQPDTTIEVCPAGIPAEIEKKLEDTAVFVHNFLGLSEYSRADFILDERGDIYFLEINTLPGMTPTSLIPQEAAAVGISYEDLCEEIVELALRERGHKQ